MQKQLQFDAQTIYVDVAYLDFSSCFIVYSHHLSQPHELGFLQVQYFWNFK